MVLHQLMSLPLIALGIGLVLGYKLTWYDCMLWSISGNKPKWYLVLWMYASNCFLVSVVAYILLHIITIIHRH